jgi:branched-chain amino acid transport system ATP-binding protein
MATKQIGDIILDVKNISLGFGGVKALTDISFNVREHEVRAIIGPNGAGKSSMLNCINGVYRPQQGAITFRGQPSVTWTATRWRPWALDAPFRIWRCSRA